MACWKWISSNAPFPLEYHWFSQLINYVIFCKNSRKHKNIQWNCVQSLFHIIILFAADDFHKKENWISSWYPKQNFSYRVDQVYKVFIQVMPLSKRCFFGLIWIILLFLINNLFPKNQEMMAIFIFIKKYLCIINLKRKNSLRYSFLVSNMSKAYIFYR